MRPGAGSLSFERVVIATHVSGERTPGHQLADWLAPRTASLDLIELPFFHSLVPRAVLRRWRKGKEQPPVEGAQRPQSIWAQLLADPGVIRRFLKGAPRAQLYVGLDNLNAFTGIVLRSFGRVDTVVYYVIDHTPQRFGNPLLNWLYGAFDRLCCRHCDHLWVLGGRMREAKLERGADPAKTHTVPIGVDLKAIGKVGPAPRKPDLVFLSYLSKVKGVQLALEAWPQVLQAVPKARLTIIGGGPYAGELKAQAKALKLGAAVRFSGRVDDHRAVLKSLKGFRAGLAAYLPDGANYAFWADPAKPKEYLAAGLPVIITRVPSIAEEIERRPMGLAIDYEAAALARACVKLLKDRAFHARCRRNALDFMRRGDWDSSFKSAFEQMGWAHPQGKKGKIRA